MSAHQAEDVVEKTNKLIHWLSRDFIVGLSVGLASSALAYLLNRWISRQHDSSDRWSNKVIKESVLEMIGHTPMLHLKSLSRALNNDIYVRFLCDRTVEDGESEPWQEQ
jgi:hypothetical protein